MSLDGPEHEVLEAWRHAGTGLDTIAFRAGYQAGLDVALVALADRVLAVLAREEPTGDVIQRVKAILDYGEELQPSPVVERGGSWGHRATGRTRRLARVWRSLAV